MSKEVVLDIETDGLGGPNGEPAKITLVGTYFYETDTYESFLEHELPQLWPKLERADRIIGYNTKGFDYPVMNNYYAGDVAAFPSLDLLEEIYKTLGFRLKLDAVATASVGAGKTGSGLQAIEYFKKGEIDKLRKYCLDDVRITKEVYEFGKKNGFINYMDRTGVKREVRIDFSHVSEAPKPVNLTLGF
jgi:DEAD/DEAH box helicase domain-containing protein